MRVLIFGAGAIGSAVGGMLSRAGCSVYLLGKPKHIERIKEKGLRITGLWGDFVVDKFEGLYTDKEISEVSRIKFDSIIVCVKSYSTEDVSKIITRFDFDVVYSFQNGIGNVETLSYFLSDVCGARIIFGSIVEDYGKIRITVYGGPILIGIVKGEKKKNVEELIKLLNDGGIPSEFVSDIQRFIWEKSLYNCALNPLSAIMNKTYGQLVDDAYSRQIMSEVIKEGFEVGTKYGIRFSQRDWREFYNYFLDFMIPPTRDHISSMIQDIKMGRRTEIDSLCGAINSIGRKYKINTKVNETLWRIIKSLENKANSEQS